jgi:hypothetical protein
MENYVQKKRKRGEEKSLLGGPLNDHSLKEEVKC